MTGARSSPGRCRCCTPSRRRRGGGSGRTACATAVAATDSWRGAAASPTTLLHILHFQEPGVADADLARDPAMTLRRTLGGRLPTAVEAAAMARPGPEGYVERLPEPTRLPDWLSQDELDYYIGEFARTGFTRALNWYRNFDRNWELMAEGARTTIDVPFVVPRRYRRPGVDLRRERPLPRGDHGALPRGAHRRRGSLDPAGTARRGDSGPADFVGTGVPALTAPPIHKAVRRSHAGVGRAT